MNNLSKETDSSLSRINKLINRAVKEIKIANARAESAEKMLEQIRLTAQSNMQKAFDEGYKKGLEAYNQNDGGTSKSKEDTKLVLKNN